MDKDLEQLKKEAEEERKALYLEHWGEDKLFMQDDFFPKKKKLDN